MAASGATIVVGAPYKNVDTGAAYVFTRSRTGWVQIAELTAADATTSSFFGGSVSVSDTRIVVGSYERNTLTGAVYGYKKSRTGWVQSVELTAPDGTINDAFGLSVALSGGTVFVGAPFKNSLTNTLAGAAYVFSL